MYLQWEYDEKAKEQIHTRDWQVNQMSPVLADEGDTFELRQLEALYTEDRTFFGLEDTNLGDTGVEFVRTWEDDADVGQRELREIVEGVNRAEVGTEEIVIHQPYLQGQVGAYNISGKGDILRLVATGDGVRPVIYEVKSSSEQKVHHRYQATIYAILLETLFEDISATLDKAPQDTLIKIITPDNSLAGPGDPEGFDTSPYRAKLSLKLEEGGSFDQTIRGTDFESTTNRIARRCSGCEYEPLCMTRGLESKGLELLGLQAGTQEVLYRLGITDLEDFVNLFDHPKDGSVHWEYSPLVPTDADLVQAVRQKADISNLQKRAQIAYRFLVEIDDNYGRDGPDFYPHPLRGTGNALPEDEHGVYEIDFDTWGGPDYPSGSLVRVYLYIQQDFAQNRVTLLSGYVECTLTNYSEEIVELPNRIPTNESEKDAEEKRLFDTFFYRLTEAIAEASPDWNERPEFEDLDLESNEGFLHLYVYSDSQRDALMEAIRRHPDARWRTAVRTLLGVRRAINPQLVTIESEVDQKMVSVLQDDFRKRWALRFPGLGAVQSVAHFQKNGEWFDWRETRSDGQKANLPDIFTAGLFNSTVRYHQAGNGIRLNHAEKPIAWTPEDRRFGKWVYPIQHREVDQIPIEYIWGVNGRLSLDVAEDPSTVAPYLYRSDRQEEKISSDDIRLLANRFARVSHHIERTIETTRKYANDRFVTKRPIDLENLRDFSFTPRTIDDVCIEYQQLEFETIRSDLESYYRQPLEERLDTGTSLAFECTSVNESDGVIEGRLLRSDRSTFDADRQGGVIGGPLSVSDGDFMVLTRLLPKGETFDRPEASRKPDPASIKNSTTVTVDDVDEESGRIWINSPSPFKDGWPRGGQYMVNHRGWSSENEAIDEDWSTHISEGEQYVLDPMVDQITQNRAYEALQNAFDAPIRRYIRQLYQGNRTKILTDNWTEEGVRDYVDRMSDSVEFFPPNQRQEDLITDINHGIIVLQGPPGTGKTKYTVAPAVLSRVHSAIQNDSGMLGVISALSHTAVDEALEATVELLESCPPGDSDDSVELIRIQSGGGGRGDRSDRVREVNYNSDDAKGEIRDLYEQYISDSANQDNRAIFFGPPVSIRSFLNRVIWEIDEHDHDNVAEMMESGEAELFDLAVIDEASMMDLPLMFLLGSFVNEGGQLMLVGDHRQMQPIQRHEWEEEDREPIENHTPFFSALDFLRYLRGEDVELDFIDREPPEFDDPEAALPIHRLEETYRLPAESAAMHTDLFYSKDGIELQSLSDGEQLPDVGGVVDEILTTDDKITLLVHDEKQSQKINPVEQALITELLQPLNVYDPVESQGSPPSSDAVSAGVVVPFRAQRRDVVGFAPRDAAVDTVERFQGGERDVMIMSMTASDRGYISQISEFLLEPNRFNVAASRMKRKLVIIASSGLFEESSDDVKRFEKQEAWISFYRAMGGLSGDFEEYKLSELVSDNTWAEFLSEFDGAANTSVKVYSGYDRDRLGLS